MTDDASNRSEALKAAAKASLLEKFERDWADAERLAAAYPEYFKILPGAAAQQPAPHKPAAEAVLSEPQKNEARNFDGTVKGLIAAYMGDPDSPYKRLKFHVRANYDKLLRRVERDIGSELIVNLDARRLKRIHEQWSESGRLSIAHSLITQLRMLSTFGGTWLKSNECRELKTVLSSMEFPMPPPRGERFTEGHATAIRVHAHKLGLPSIALAQAFQFDCRLRQNDVVGEWVPIGEQSEPSAEIDDNMKWIRGLRWSSIDDDFRLRHVTNRGQRPVDIDLKLAPMVMEELRAQYCAVGEPLTRAKLPPSGPIINSEQTGRPYHTYQFRYRWRQVANAAGVPKTVKNMDSRAPARLDRLDPSRRHLRKKEMESAS